jgi:hypothetical protein
MNANPSATEAARTESPNQQAISTPPAEFLVRAALDDIALVIGGAAALHQLNDDVVWSLIKRLDRIRLRLFRDLRGLAPRPEGEMSSAKPPRVHAAVEEFLVRNRAGMGE